MSRYDYGLRGPSDTTPPRLQGKRQLPYGYSFNDYGVGTPPSNHVTAPYNQDYLRDTTPAYPWNPYRYGADGPGRIVGEDEYTLPYVTRGGTWTNRGISPHLQDDDRLPPFQAGRYPDE